ncbi:MAG: tyrosine-type recombinase/integrase [Fibrobacter sp.]|nr:tyrosine-type recombinase/integrase [Fibrobacter sp.]
MENSVQQFRQWMEIKRYSHNTIKVYTDIVKLFLTHLSPNQSLEQINLNDVNHFIQKIIINKKLSSSYQNQVVNALKLYFQVTKQIKIDVHKLSRPRRSYKLPNVLSSAEVKAILNALTNTKHRTMLSLIYACGLRRSELLNLRPIDVDSKRMILLIKEAKGKKDRIVPISAKIVEMLRAYYKIYRPKIWLFEGQQAGEKYGERSLQLVLKQATRKAHIKKPVTLHWLRHSYATHLLEKGTSLRYIQELLGHKSSKTTEIYTHVSTRSICQIKSPFDDL